MSLNSCIIYTALRNKAGFIKSHVDFRDPAGDRVPFEPWTGLRETLEEFDVPMFKWVFILWYLPSH